MEINEIENQEREISEAFKTCRKKEINEAKQVF